MVTNDVVVALYSEGVDAVRRHTEALTREQWSMPACGSWSAADTARHLLSVAAWYHDWLDRAIAGDTSRPFDGANIDAYTASALADRRHLAAPDAAAEFVASAGDYLDRAHEHWELPFAYPFGVVTVGLHARLAATEWHLHAWDLSGVGAERHCPSDPARLMIAAGECVSATQGGVRGAVVGRIVPLAARRSPWQTMLRRSGRA